MNSTVERSSFVAHQDVLYPRPSLISGISDYTLSLIVPMASHWLTAAVYETLEYFSLFQRYKIHTNDEEVTKNSISRWECLRGVLLVQVLQTGLGILLGLSSEVELTGHESRDVAIWASRLHTWGQLILLSISFSGLKVQALISTLSRSAFVTSSFASGEAEHKAVLFAAQLIYYGLIPALRLYLALWLADAWVFFIHRAEHSNKWLYRTFHARHHELNVAYSWGGIYDHPVESMFLSVGAFVVAVVGTGMSLRESMVFSAFSSIKACTDHSGYKFPWNPVDLFTTVDAEYHDKHHQRWGYKNNFALHFQFWDRLLGTDFSDTEAASKLYTRDRKAAEVARKLKGAKIKHL
ncbi:MAG: hypothetical protein Q9222_003526 [Ikaeria aurantiellina]